MEKLIATVFFVSGLCFAYAAFGADKLVHFPPIADGVAEFSIEEPDGWLVGPASKPLSISLQPKLTVIGLIESPDKAIKGEIKYFEKSGDFKIALMHDFFKDYAHDVMHAEIQKDLVLGGDEKIGVYRMMYTIGDTAVLLEQVCNGPNEALSVLIKIPAGNKDAKTAAAILNNMNCRLL